jgi:putative Mg2+ transporter-C (MgtC) family protein
MIQEVLIVLQFLLAAFLGGLIGFERRAGHKEAGVRTHALVAMGAALFSSVSIYGFANLPGSENLDPSRIMSSIVTGIGFLGAGMIIFRQERVRGLTTAAGLWVCAAIGMAVAVGWYLAAIIGTMAIVGVLHFVPIVFPTRNHQKGDDQE